MLRTFSKSVALSTLPWVTMTGVATAGKKPNFPNREEGKFRTEREGLKFPKGSASGVCYMREGSAAWLLLATFHSTRLQQAHQDDSSEPSLIHLKRTTYLKTPGAQEVKISCNAWCETVHNRTAEHALRQHSDFANGREQVPTPQELHEEIDGILVLVRLHKLYLAGYIFLMKT